jgi:sigma-E factor negative regulatory protein RseA
VVLAPRTRISKKLSYLAMSVAASVSALALVVWMAMQIQREPAPALAQQQLAPIAQARAQSVEPATKAVQSKAINKEMGDYLVAHQEVSPTTEMAGATTYIHTVAARK